MHESSPKRGIPFAMPTSWGIQDQILVISYRKRIGALADSPCAAFSGSRGAAVDVCHVSAAIRQQGRVRLCHLLLVCCSIFCVCRLPAPLSAACTCRSIGAWAKSSPAQSLKQAGRLCNDSGSRRSAQQALEKFRMCLHMPSTLSVSLRRSELG